VAQAPAFVFDSDLADPAAGRRANRDLHRGQGYLGGDFYADT